MPTINRSALVPYTTEQMFDIVNDVDKYADYLPWCGGAEKHEQEGEFVKASVTISKGAINKTFTTRNIIQENESIEMQLIDGPFKELNGFWRFTDLNGEACKISFDLEFEFSNGLVGMAIGPIFNQIASSMVDAFVERAKDKHG